MTDQGKGYEIIRGNGVAEPSKAEEILKKLLGDEDLKVTSFYKEPGAVIEPHYHTENLAAYVLRGKIQIKTGEDLSNTLEFSEGDGFTIKKGIVHREEVISDVPCEMTGAHINPYETVKVGK